MVAPRRHCCNIRGGGVIEVHDVAAQRLLHCPIPKSIRRSKRDCRASVLPRCIPEGIHNVEVRGIDAGIKDVLTDRMKDRWVSPHCLGNCVSAQLRACGCA